MTTLLGAAAMLTLCSFEASAQFTAVVGPARAKAAPVADTVAKTVAQKQDSVTKISLTNMKDWVDSAASSLGVPVSAPVTDTAAPAPTVPTVPTPAAPPAPARATTEFREGATAPNTATPIPLLALVGGGCVLTGLWLLRRRRA